MTRFFSLLLVLAILGAGTFWYLTRPTYLAADTFKGVTGDAARGETIFWAGGCASCHAAPGASGDERLVLAGGREFGSDFGLFRAPNISPSEAGIAGWSVLDLGNAMQRGVGPDGTQYFPAFPYNAYIHMPPQDIADLHAYLMTLPPSDTETLPHDIEFPFGIRRNLGGWKWLFLNDDWVLAGDDLSPELERGRYLVEGLAHCGECHTPRNALGGLEPGAWLSGAVNPSGDGRIPNISPGGLDWSESDIAEYLKSGFTPEFDVVGGEMAEVVENTSNLTDEDRAAIAAYLKAVPPIE